MQNAESEKQREERVKMYADALAYALENPDAVKDETLCAYLQMLKLLILQHSSECDADEG